MKAVPSISELRKLCQATAPNPARESKVGLFSRIFSIYFTKLFLYTSFTPNQITVISTLVFFAGIGMFFVEEYTFNLFGAFLVFFSIVLDGCDGEVARFRKNGSVAGTMYVEPVSHDFQYGFSFLILACALVWQGAPSYLLVLGAVAGLTKLVFRLLELRFWMIRYGSISDEEIEAMKKKYTAQPWYMRLFHWTNKNFFSSTGVFLTLLIFTLVKQLPYYLWFYAIGYGGILILLFAKHVYLFYSNQVLAPSAQPRQSE